jgi:hypothetical protein
MTLEQAIISKEKEKEFLIKNYLTEYIGALMRILEANKNART